MISKDRAVFPFSLLSDPRLPGSLPSEPTGVISLAAEADRRGQTPQPGPGATGPGAPHALWTTAHAALLHSKPPSQLQEDARFKAVLSSGL